MNPQSISIRLALIAVTILFVLHVPMEVEGITITRTVTAFSTSTETKTISETRKVNLVNSIQFENGILFLNVILDNLREIGQRHGCLPYSSKFRV
jgi:hypothetical protein